MTHYAAGCEHCGADLDAHRRRAASEPVAAERERFRLELPGQPSAMALVYFGLTVFAVLWISVLGLIMALLGALHGFYEQHVPTIAVFGALAILAAALEVSRL